MAKDPVQPSSLPGEINAATRASHTALNRLITSRLSLCLPPYTNAPTLYTIGLLHFAHVYLTFESLWADLPRPAAELTPSSPLLSFLLVDPWDPGHAPDKQPGATTPPTNDMVEFLLALRSKGLARSARLKTDLEFLTGMRGTDLSVALSQFPGSRVQQFCAHIRRTVKARPHLLVAYAWCFYMAVFSGGRWIRGELTAAGDDFWTSSTARDTISEPGVPLYQRGLSFWFFTGDEDGEDVKTEFKKRLAAAEDLFTPEQRAEVVAEAKTIFRRCALLVDELDEKLATSAESLGQVEVSQRQHARAAATKTDARRKRVLDKPGSLWSLAPWMRRARVTGTLAVLGCLAGVALLRLDFDGLLSPISLPEL